MRFARGALALVIGAIALSGCHVEPSPEPTFETENFRYYVDSSRARCDRVTAWLEHYAMSLKRTLGTSPGKIDYHLYSDTVALTDSGCDALGCTTGNEVRSVFPVHSHELVHVYANALGHPPSLFEEGLASVLGCTSEPSTQTMTNVDDVITSAGFEEAPRADAYATSASFVRHLRDRHGHEAFLDVYARLSHDASRTDISSAFVDAFRTSLNDEIAAWRAAPPTVICDRQIECSMMHIARERQTQVDLLCGRQGPPAELVFRVDIKRDSVFELEFSGSPTRGISIHQCSGTAMNDFSQSTDGRYTAPLSPDSYLIRLRGDAVGKSHQIHWMTIAADEQLPSL